MCAAASHPRLPTVHCSKSALGGRCEPKSCSVRPTGAQGDRPVTSHIRRAAVAAALACAVLVPSFASARGGGHFGGGHSAGAHFGFAGAPRAGFARSGFRAAHLSGRRLDAHRAAGRSLSRNHGRTTTSKHARTSGKVAKRPPRGEGSSRGDGPSRDHGHRHPPRGPIVTIGNPASTPVATAAPATGTGATAGTTKSGGGASPGGGGSSSPPGRNGCFPPPAGENRYVPNEVLLDIEQYFVGHVAIFTRRRREAAVAARRAGTSAAAGRRAAAGLGRSRCRAGAGCRGCGRHRRARWIADRHDRAARRMSMAVVA